MAEFNNEFISIDKLPLILQLDVSGMPHAWITYEKSAYYHTKGLVAWVADEQQFTLHGGISSITGEMSSLTMNTIIAVKGKISARQQQKVQRVSLTNKTLFRRDQQTCAYCGARFSPAKLTRDHVIPTSKGGRNVWTNVVTSCSPCNKRKDNHDLNKIDMELLYMPYAPNKAEHLILQNKKILADQMEFLIKQVPKESRLLT